MPYMAPKKLVQDGSGTAMSNATLSHTHNFVTQNSFTHNMQAQLCRIPLFHTHTHTRNIVKRNFVTQCHTQLLNTRTRLCHNSVVCFVWHAWQFVTLARCFCVAGVALGGIGTWLAEVARLGLYHAAAALCGNLGTSLQSGRICVARLGLCDAAAVFFHGTLWQSGCICVAGVALTLLCVARKLAVAWLRGRHGTCCWVAGEALGDTHTHTHTR